MSTVTEERKDFVLTKDKACRYLTLYTGEANWEKHLATLYSRLTKNNSPENAQKALRKAVAFAVLMPTYDRTKLTTPPENLFFAGSSYNQFNDRDWAEELGAVIERDEEIKEWRGKALSLGFVDPIEYSPVTRQAFNWLFGKAEDSGVVNNDNKKQIAKMFEKLVIAYGGNVICYIFMKEEWKINKKILNWRTNYFFERLIFDVYTPEQVLKIKKQELMKTNSKLVKSILR